jgi:hypothetical protein
MPAKGGFDEFDRKMEWLRCLFSNYNKAIEFISGLTAPYERYAPTIAEILETDKKVREENKIED